MSVILQALGAACLITVLPLIILSFVLVWKLGRIVAAINPSLWDEMKPGMYSDIRVSRAHRQRLSEFLSTREYLSLNSPSADRVAVAYKIVRAAAVVALIGAVATVLWAVGT